MKNNFLFFFALFVALLSSCEEDLTTDLNGTAEVFFTVENLREIENATQGLAINIGLDNPTHGGGGVDVTITGGEYGVDYTSSGGGSNFTVEIEAGSLVESFTILPVDDERIGANSNLVIQLSNPTGSLSLGESTQINFTVIDDDDPLVAFVGFETETVSIAENADENLTINLTFDQVSTNGGSISITTTGDAVYGTDYELAGQTEANFTLDVPAGASSASFTLQPIDNDSFEADKQAIFEVTTVSGGLELNTATTTEVTIVNDDAAPNPLIDFDSANPTTFSEADGSVTINFILTEATTQESTVAITASGDATIGEDYTIDSTSDSPYILTIPAGASSASLTLELIDDTETEGDESLTLTITEVTGNVDGGVDLQQQTYTIIDDDNATPYSFAETFESGAALTDLGFSTVLIDQDFNENQVFGTHNRDGDYAALNDVSAASNWGLQMFYKADDAAGYGTLDNATISPVNEAQGAMTVSYDVAFVTGSRRNISEITFYWSDTYDGSGTWNDSDWNSLETVTAASLEGEGISRTQFSRREYNINPTANFYLAARITQEVTADNNVVQWRYDNFQVNSN